MKNQSRQITHAALLLLLLFWHAVPARAQKDPLNGLDEYIEKAMRDWELPGLAIAVVKDDKVVFAKGYGVREIGKPEKVDEGTLFAVASNTKAFTATALGLLVKEGKLSWNDPVIKHLPGLQLHDPYATRELIIRDLLTHRSGYSTWSGDLMWYGTDLSREEVLKRVRHLKPATSFRSQYGYSNLMFLAAGQIIPSITGTSWDDFVKQRFFTPLGMSRTNISVKDLQKSDNVAMPHTRIDEKIVVIPYRNVDNVAPAAAINSSVSDWTQWLRLQLANGSFNGKQLVDSSVIQETRVPHTLLRIGLATRKLFPSTHFSAYGLGWFLRDYHGRLLVMHDGGMDGMLSQTVLVPEENLGLVIFTNYDQQNLFGALSFRVIDAYLGVPARDWSTVFLELDKENRNRELAARKTKRAVVKGTKPGLNLSQYAGTYTNEMLGEATIVEKDGLLQLQLKENSGARGNLQHWHYDTFQVMWADRYFLKSLVTFVPNGKGQVEEFRVKIREDFVDPLEYSFKRKT